jgi:glc operon protein GlcG
MEPLEMIAAM